MRAGLLAALTPDLRDARVLDLRDLLYFALVIIFFLLASTVVLEARKSR